MFAYPKLTVLLVAVSSLLNVAEARNLFRDCVSPQHGIIGNPYVIRCITNTEFEGVYWFEASNEREPVIRFEDDTKLGRGYDKKEYDIEIDGSLKIQEVSEKHQMVYKVVVIDKDYTIDERLVTFFAHRETIVEIPYTDPSHQFGLLGKRAIIKFNATSGFQGVYWYDQWNAQDPFIRYEDGTTLGRGYDSGEFDILPAGSLIIKNVTLSHEMVYSVVVIDENFVTHEHEITFSSVVYAEKSVPLITNCIPGTYCHVYIDDVDNLLCMVVGARPAVKLEWFQKFSGTKETIVPFSFNPVAPEDQTSHLFNSSAVLPTDTLSNITHTVFQCKATGPAIESSPFQQTILLESKQFYNGLKNSSDIETVVTIRNISLPCNVAGENSLIVWRVGATVNELKTIVYTFKGNEVEYADSEVGIDKGGHLMLNNTQRYLDKVFVCIAVDDNDNKFGQMYRISDVDTSDENISKEITTEGPGTSPKGPTTYTSTGITEYTTLETSSEMETQSEEILKRETTTVTLAETTEITLKFTTEVASKPVSGFGGQVAAEECTVSTSQGIVRGETIWFTYDGSPSINKTIDVFKGIPYAEPPVGPNRFQKPVPKAPWESTLNTTTFRPICWQVPKFDSIPTQSEDCLFLNIWSPSVKRSKIPVMVWIHGGAFVVGSTTSEIYDGRPLTAYNDVVVVSVQYRLNGFGFLTTGDEVLRGNYGLWDQNLALSWIKENIAAFGGDPDRITLFGQSAGGISVGFQLLQPLSWSYFNNAIMMSGSMLNPSGIIDTSIAIDTAYTIGRRVGCEMAFTSTELAECLRNVDEYKLTLAMDTVILKLRPTVDGEFITALPVKLVEEGLFKQVSIMTGTTLNDGVLGTVKTYPDQIFKPEPFSDREDFRERLQKAYTFVTPLILDAIEQQYIDWSSADDPDANYFYTYMDIETDETYLCPQDAVSRKYVEETNDVFRYLFTHEPSASVWPRFPVWKGVAHIDDVPFVFGSAFLPEFADVTVPQEEIDLSVDMMTYFTNFAKTGNPNYGEEENCNTTESPWLKYTMPSQMFKELRPGLSDLRAYRASYCAFWNDVIPNLISYRDGLSETERGWREDFIHWRHTAMKDWRESFFDYEMLKEYETC